jgi:hypothetical protein
MRGAQRLSHGIPPQVRRHCNCGSRRSETGASSCGCRAVFLQQRRQRVDRDGADGAAVRGDVGRLEQGIVDRLFGGVEDGFEEARHAVGRQDAARLRRRRRR